MAWTTPRTWVASEVVTASLLNTHLRDNLAALGDPWASWTPSWTASTTNPAIGNGAIVGAWVSAGKLTFFRAEITMGSTTTYGTGSWQLSLPTPEEPARWIFHGTARDASGAVTYPLVAERTASGLLTMKALPTTAGNAYANVTSTVPFTWATSDVVSIAGTYEAA